MSSLKKLREQRGRLIEWGCVIATLGGGGGAGGGGEKICTFFPYLLSKKGT